MTTNSRDHTLFAKLKHNRFFIHARILVIQDNRIPCKITKIHSSTKVPLLKSTDTSCHTVTYLYKAEIKIVFIVQ